MSFSKQNLIIFSVNVLFIYVSVVYLYIATMKIEPMFIRDFSFSVFAAITIFLIKSYLLKKSNKE